MRIVRLVAGAALGTLLASAGCSSQRPAPAGDTAGEPATASVAQAIENGTVDSPNKYTFAVGVCWSSAGMRASGGPKYPCESTCSGTLVLQNMVITARHCVSQVTEPIDCTNGTFGPGMGPPQTFAIMTGYQMQPGAAGWHNVKQILVPSDDHVCSNDLAILILNDLVPSAEARLAVPGVQYPMGDARYAINYTAVGYGITSPSDSTGSTAGTRRYKTNLPIGCIPGDPNLDCPPGTNFPEKEFAGGDGTCRGDSGSGAFEQKSFDTGTAPVSWGVLSRGSDDPTHCKGSAYTRLDAWRDFVVQAADQASNNWSLYGKPSPDWTVYVPPTSKDAGAKDAAPSTSKPSGSALGDACNVDKDCASGVCVDAPDDTRACSQACDATNTCPDGFACKDGDCFVDALVTTSPAAAQTTTTTGGCSTSPAGAAGSTGTFAALGAALALVTAARRRRG